MKTITFITLAFTSFCITGCTTDRSSSPYVHAPYATTQVLVGQCLFLQGSGESAAIASALAGLVIDKAFNIVAAGLRAAGSEQKEYLSGFGNFDTPPASLSKTCVTIVQGRFFSSVSQDPDANYFKPAWANTAGLDEEKLKLLAKWHRIYFVDKPDFMMESVISGTSVSGVFTLRPLYALMTEPVERPWADYSGNRHIAILFSFFAAGGNPQADSNPGTEIILGNLAKDQPLIFRYPSNDKSPSKQRVKSDNSNTDKFLAAPYLRWPNEGRFFKLDSGFLAPSTVRVMVTQTKSENKLMTFLADAFDSVEKDLASTAKQALIPSVAQEAKLAAQNQQLSKLNSYNTTYNAALEALGKCANSKVNPTSNMEIFEALQLAQTAHSAQISANIAAKANDFAEPFTAKQIIVASGKSARADCDKVLTSKLASQNDTSPQEDDPAGPPP